MTFYRFSLAEVMCMYGYMKPSEESGKMQLTSKALAVMSFDPVTMKTSFSEVNIHPIEDPIRNLLEQLVKNDMCKFGKNFGLDLTDLTCEDGTFASWIELPKDVKNPMGRFDNDGYKFADKLEKEGLIKRKYSTNCLFPVPERNLLGYEITDKGMSWLETDENLTEKCQYTSIPMNLPDNAYYDLMSGPID